MPILALPYGSVLNVPTASLLGRYGSGTGKAQTISVGTGLALSGGGSLSTATGVPTSSANPSAQIGQAAVNGSATTFMTSDSAPQLSPSIYTRHALTMFWA